MNRAFLFVGIVLIVLHHDFWWWEASWPVLGFLPIGLAYHALLSLAAALFWLAVTRAAWADDANPDESGESR